MALTKPGIQAVLSLPDHNEVRMGTLRDLIKTAGLTDDDYRKRYDEL